MVGGVEGGGEGAGEVGAGSGDTPATATCGNTFAGSSPATAAATAPTSYSFGHSRDWDVA
jgi:hypothetical protein